jgi:branched-chain amino acid transport system permease protein
MDVLNFAHGVFLTLGAYAGWAVAAHLPQRQGVMFLVTAVAATAAGAAVAAATELLLIRPL